MSSKETTSPSPANEDPHALASTSIDPDTVDTDSTPHLSKNARKRLLKAERIAASKAERRARDKQKKRERAEKRRAGDIDALEEAEQRKAKRQRVEITKKIAPKQPFKARVVIDLAFDDRMTEKEVVSLCSQLAYTYSSNRKSRVPFDSLLCTSLNGKTLDRLTALGDNYKRWHGVEFWKEDYDQLWSAQDELRDQRCSKESVVYLTGDAEHELEELKEGETYIIGGICDRNRYKNLCLNKAKEQNIRSARLPIGTYMADLPTRKILTVNQVFDILLHWVEERDWSKALFAIMPKRKFQQGGQNRDVSSPQAAQEASDAGVSGAIDEDANEDAVSSL